MQVWSWVRKIPGEGNGHPLQGSRLENFMDREAWWVAKSQTHSMHLYLCVCIFHPSVYCSFLRRTETPQARDSGLLKSR